MLCLCKLFFCLFVFFFVFFLCKLSVFTDHMADLFIFRWHNGILHSCTLKNFTKIGPQSVHLSSKDESFCAGFQVSFVQPEAPSNFVNACFQLLQKLSEHLPISLCFFVSFWCFLLQFLYNFSHLQPQTPSLHTTQHSSLGYGCIFHNMLDHVTVFS